MSEEDGSNYVGTLGVFGCNSDVKARKVAERKAAMRPDDGRRRKGPPRNIQFNPRVTKQTKALVERIVALEGGSQADLIERMVDLYIKTKGIL